MADNDINPSTGEYRRVTAILAADVMGYSALMGANEEQTVRDIKGHFSIILPMVVRAGGRVIDTAGDGIFAEFASVVQAVRCAVAMQMVMAERNRAVEATRIMPFRIGINLADVLSDATRIYGDGVNIAARLESICEPGRIAISSKVYEEVKDRFGFVWSDAGEMEMKNIRQSVHVYRFVSGDLPVDAIELQSTGAAVATRHDLHVTPISECTSIAVLPFNNMSGNPEQEYFTDGITEDIITELSRFSDLEVIARNSTFQYKGRAVDVRVVSRELGVRYVLEGSVRQAGDRIRVTAQLIDAQSGNHIWADRYDRKLVDTFEIQDELVRTIVPILASRMNRAEIARIATKPPANWQAYDYYMRAMAAFQEFSREPALGLHNRIRELAEECLRLDPHLARGHVLRSTVSLTAWSIPLSERYQRPDVLARALASAERAVSLDNLDPQAHAQLGYVYVFQRRPVDAMAQYEAAVALNPNYVDWRYPAILLAAGHAERAIEIGERYRRLDPFASPAASIFVALAYYSQSRFAEALKALDGTLAPSMNHVSRRVIRAASLAKLGRVDEAKAEADDVLRIKPDWHMANAPMMGGDRSTTPFHKLFAEGLRAAGLPE
jgi:adenylate cyclase